MIERAILNYVFFRKSHFQNHLIRFRKTLLRVSKTSYRQRE